VTICAATGSAEAASGVTGSQPPAVSSPVASSGIGQMPRAQRSPAIATSSPITIPPISKVKRRLPLASISVM